MKKTIILCSCGEKHEVRHKKIENEIISFLKKTKKFSKEEKYIILETLSRFHTLTNKDSEHKIMF